MGGSAPKQPDYAKQSIEAMQADLQYQPILKQIEAAAALGTKVTVNGQTYDFTGLGAADTQKLYQDAMLKSGLQTQQQLGPQYIEQAIKERELADPQGAAMMRQEWDAIKAQAQNLGQYQSPIAEQLQANLIEQVKNAGKLTDRELQQIIQRSRGSQAARGNLYGAANAAQETAAAVQASDQKRAAINNQAMTFLTSGLTPAATQERLQQQAMQNLGAFVNGQTPSAQFGNVANAANGAAPFNANWQSSVNPNMNIGTAGANWGQSIYGQQSGMFNNQISPYMTALTGLLGGASSFVNMGGLNMLGGGGGSFNTQQQQMLSNSI